METLVFNNIRTTKFNRVWSALLNISADWIGCYAKYLFFNSNQWTGFYMITASVMKELRIPAKQKYWMYGRIPFNSFARANGFPPLDGKKWVGMIDLHWRASKFNEDKGWFSYKIIFWQLPWDPCYKGKKKEIWKTKKSKK